MLDSSTVHLVASVYNSNDIINHPLQLEVKQEPYEILPTAAVTVPELCSNRPIMAISIFNITFDALIDSGATWSMGSRPLYELCVSNNVPMLDCKQRFTMSNGLDMVGRRYMTVVPITVGDRKIQQRDSLAILGIGRGWLQMLYFSANKDNSKDAAIWDKK
ncbi:hypothetical protein CHUAL_010706 [Chamberlinius hualienensis]